MKEFDDILGKDDPLEKAVKKELKEQIEKNERKLMKQKRAYYEKYYGEYL